MNKKYFALLLLPLVFAGWQYRSASNRPASVVVTASSTNVPSSFSSASGSLVMRGLSSGSYSHVQVINDRNKVPLSFLTIPEVSSAPAASVTSQRLHVVSSGTSTFDDISVFDNLYIKTEDGGTLTSGDVRINVW